jgi:hypothetical protein
MFKDDAVSVSTFELYFNLLYSVYSIPNILLPFLGARHCSIRVCDCRLSLHDLGQGGTWLIPLGCAFPSWPSP